MSLNRGYDGKSFFFEVDGARYAVSSTGVVHINLADARALVAQAVAKPAPLNPPWIKPAPPHAPPKPKK